MKNIDIKRNKDIEISIIERLIWYKYWYKYGFKNGYNMILSCKMKHVCLYVYMYIYIYLYIIIYIIMNVKETIMIWLISKWISYYPNLLSKIGFCCNCLILAMFERYLVVLLMRVVNFMNL